MPDLTNFGAWEGEVETLEASVRVHPVPLDPVVFVGSSSIKYWFSLARDFPHLPVVNRGFGGSTIRDAIHFASRLLFPLSPLQVLLYSGENDLAAGASPRSVYNDFREFVEVARGLCPDTAVSLISIKPSPSRRLLLPKIRAVNLYVSEWCAKDADIGFIDVFGPMLNSEGEPRNELWTLDGIHLSRAGYRMWAKVIGPHLLHERKK